MNCADLEKCPICHEPKICPITKKPYQEFHTILLGPVLQALWRDPSSARRFDYRRKITQEIINELEENDGTLSSYDDFFHGSDYLENVKKGSINNNDIVLMLSIDGAQLYTHKASDCWIYIWVIMDLSPDERYKKRHVLPGGFIPGPNKPKNVDSFQFPGLHHLCSLQREGLRIWDASTNRLFLSKLFLALDTADGPGMAYQNGLVGHHGKYGCRLYCSVPGRHKPHGSHYYPALLKPNDYIMHGCDHEDISHFVSTSAPSNWYFQNLQFLLQSPNETQYKKRRLETGITKPTIFLGIPNNCILGIPGCFGSDVMHLGSFNLADLLVSLWRGQLDSEGTDPTSAWPWAVLQGNTWEQHGKAVAEATPYLPGSFDRPPRNIAEKINSGYKAWEWLLYLYGLAPALLYGILPQPYYSHFCKLVKAMRIIQQHKIKTSDLRMAKDLLQSFAYEYEMIYYQRRVDRLHFCRQSIHALLHLAAETTRIGPPICSSQWTMERTIGNLGEEIRQPSNPYANLSQRGLLRCQVNALNAMIPDLQPEPSGVPRGGIDLGGGFALLRAQDRYDRAMRPCEAQALANYLWNLDGTLVESHCPKIARWARLRLPNGQVARSRWKESRKPLKKVRMSRNVKYRSGDKLHIGEVYYYFRCRIHGQEKVLAVVSKYSEPDSDLLAVSHGTFLSCQYSGDGALVVIDVSCIESVVAMVPHNHTRPHSIPDTNLHFFLVERPGLDIWRLGGFQDESQIL
ncbi:hypothetical protein BDN70DRAFT_939565 [Pholiota conissans]|uniref:Uncharacterized protein n=1 Tax=Pholiota conissans TaxID=109636 RepID=A0A9P6CL13_9AGAR|nr:hypothetical protein BDN70DRAFT_939565 [Pholiota conissans]